MCGRVVKYQTFLTVFVGVKQGKSLSPLLFILILNDLADDLPVRTAFDDSIIEDFQKFIQLFADDTLLMANNVPNYRQC